MQFLVHKQERATRGIPRTIRHASDASKKKKSRKTRRNGGDCKAAAPGPGNGGAEMRPQPRSAPWPRSTPRSCICRRLRAAATRRSLLRTALLHCGGWCEQLRAELHRPADCRASACGAATLRAASQRCRE